MLAWKVTFAKLETYRTWARDEAWKTAPTALPKVLSEKGTSVDSVDIERIKGVYKSSAYPLLHLIHSNTPLESVPQGLHEFWALKERSSLFGKARTPPENQTLAVWEAETVFERFATVIPLGGNAFLAEWSYVFRLEDRSRAMIFPASVSVSKHSHTRYFVMSTAYNGAHRRSSDSRGL